MQLKHKITPFIWYDDDALGAAEFYVSCFDDSAIVEVMDGPTGTPLTVTFRLAGQEFIALNGGTYCQLDESFSMFVLCDDQAEVDRLWTKLTSNGGSAIQCGWLKDRWGLRWQVVPRRLGELLSDPDRDRAGRAHYAACQTSKPDIAAIEAAADDPSGPAWATPD